MWWAAALSKAGPLLAGRPNVEAVPVLQVIIDEQLIQGRMVASLRRLLRDFTRNGVGGGLL